MNTDPGNRVPTFRAPLLIAMASLIGLITALIGDGLLDVVSWIAFGGVLGIIARFLIIRTRRS